MLCMEPISDMGASPAAAVAHMLLIYYSGEQMEPHDTQEPAKTLSLWRAPGNLCCSRCLASAAKLVQPLKTRIRSPTVLGAITLLCSPPFSDS